ncbi:MAG: hypothetical protein OXH75_17765 [Acidobacteria bacterium]|nr:hypothetical protein [Acidobacteriota bacterium]MCY4028147.1 hypothetical protein [Acidobacteriota bacterium]
MAAVGMGDALWAVDHSARVAEAKELGQGPDRTAAAAATPEAVWAAVELGVDAAEAGGRAVSVAIGDGFDDAVAFLIDYEAVAPFG